MNVQEMSVQLLQAAGQTGEANWSFLIMMVALFAIMYFFMIRPQNKQRKEIQRFRDNLTVGQEIVTAGGIYGTIRSIDEANNTVLVEVATGVKIKFSKNSIYSSANAAQQTAGK